MLYLYRYEFKPVWKDSIKTAADYSKAMIAACKEEGMKPVCDDPAYCKGDAKALYLGQNNHLSYPPHRNNAYTTPTGFAEIRGRWLGKCSYTGSANPGKALCEIMNAKKRPDHKWATPADLNTGFVCGRVLERGLESTVRLAAHGNARFRFELYHSMELHPYR